MIFIQVFYIWCNALLNLGGYGVSTTELLKVTCCILKFDFTLLGTSERVCLITGSVDAIMAVLTFIMEKIREKPDMNAKQAIDFDNKTSADRDKQVSFETKVLVSGSSYKYHFHHTHFSNIVISWICCQVDWQIIASFHGAHCEDYCILGCNLVGNNLFTSLHGVTFQKTRIFVVTAVLTRNLYFCCCYISLVSEV